MYNFFQILYPSSFIFFVCILLSFLFDKSNFKLFLIPIIFKVSLFFYYFTFIFDGSQVFLDDITYLDKGEEILNLSIDSNYWKNLTYIIQSNTHILYPIINSLAIILFEAEYYAPVALNVIFSFLACLLLFNYLNNYRNKILIFFLIFFNPTIITWSSFFNLKDTLLLLLIVVNFISFEYIETNKKKFVFLFMLSLIFIFFLRSYYSFIILFSILVIYLRKFNLINLFLTFIFVLLLLNVFFFKNIYLYYYEIFNQMHNLSLFSYIKFFLTPIPFNTTGTYKFLDFPQIYYYLMFPFFLLGYMILFYLFLINKLDKSTMFIVLSFSIYFILISGMEIVNGPRHRYQLETIIIIFQYTGIRYVFKLSNKYKNNL